MTIKNSPSKRHQSVGLDFYLKEAISPVHVDISDLKKHFQTRSSLYRLLGIPSNYFKRKKVLEVAAGSGHNSLFISYQRPSQFDICEPNPIAIEDLIKLYKKYDEIVDIPQLFRLSLEEFDTEYQYDIVICEGWLGGRTEYERSLLKKLASYVSESGILSISFFPPIGGISSYLRRLISFRLINQDMPLNEKTEILKEAFSSHLSTLPHLSRSHEHWIQDSLLNPHIYIGPLEPDTALDVLGDDFTVYQSVPVFINDWRWYKSLYGEQRQFNRQFSNQYHSWSHNFIDYRFLENVRNPASNRQLTEMVEKLIQNCQEFETHGQKAYQKTISPILTAMMENCKNEINPNTWLALKEVDNLLKQNISALDASSLEHFSALFGREQCYLSFIRETIN